jgi:hypothetical protein
VTDDEFGVTPDVALTRFRTAVRNGAGVADSFTVDGDASASFDGEPVLSFDDGLGVSPSPVERVGFWRSPSASGPGAMRPGLEREPPVPWAAPVLGSVAAGEVPDDVPVALVELEGADPLGGVWVDDGVVVEGVCAPVVEVAPVVAAPGVDGDSAVPGVEGADGELSADGSANAIPGELATAAPTPSATASAPTRPI